MVREEAGDQVDRQDGHLTNRLVERPREGARRVGRGRDRDREVGERVQDEEARGLVNRLDGRKQ